MVFLILFMAGILILLFYALYLRINAVVFFNMHYTFILSAFMYLYGFNISLYQTFSKLELCYLTNALINCCFSRFCSSKREKKVIIEVLLLTVED